MITAIFALLSLVNPENRKSFTISNLDVFGGFPTFNIETKDKYRTKIGALWSFAFIGFTIATMYYYISRVADNTSPVVQYNMYDSTDYLDDD